jgi:class 3 adenylate cyclase
VEGEPSPQTRYAKSGDAGDGLFVRFDGPARAVRCAQAVVVHVRDLGIQIRSGLHTDEVELTSEGIKALARHIGARMSAMAGAGRSSSPRP